MDIVGKCNRAADTVVWERDCMSLESLTRLCARLAATADGEQFVFREVELDCCYRQADGEARIAEHGGDSAGLSRSIAIRERVFAAHDFVGTRNLSHAINALNEVADLVMGLH